MKLRYSSASPYVRKVMVTALETGQEGKIEKVSTTVVPVKENAELSRENPLTKVPTLITDDGQALFDSPVICEYLDSLHGGAKLFPPAGAARWKALTLQALGDGILDAALLTRYEKAVRPQDLAWGDWIDGQMRKIRQGLDALEAGVGELSGSPTIGTVAIGCALGYLDFRFADENWRSNRPKLAAWYADFAQRPSMKATAPQG
jgi:glutathione S-transferase